MELQITKQKAEWNKSATAEKELCCVEFPNCISTTTQKSFKWYPTYRQMAEIMQTLAEVEQQWKQKREVDLKKEE